MIKGSFKPSLYTYFTLGILGIFLGLLFIFRGSVGTHLQQQQRYTNDLAKSRILGYQTPDFKTLAQMLYTQTPLTPNMINDRLKGQYYLTFYTKAASLYPDSFEMHYCLGFCQLINGDIAAAKASLIQSLKINPSFIYGYYNLALLLLKEGDKTRAEKLLSTALLIDPTLTLRALVEKQAFNIIWRFIPEPQHYLTSHLQQTLINVQQLLKDLNKTHDFQPIFF